MEQVILDIISSHLKKEVSIDDNVIDLGADSLDASDIAYKINNRYPVKIKAKELIALESVRSIVEEVNNRYSNL